MSGRAISVIDTPYTLAVTMPWVTSTPDKPRKIAITL